MHDAAKLAANDQDKATARNATHEYRAEIAALSHVFARGHPDQIDVLIAALASRGRLASAVLSLYVLGLAVYCEEKIETA